MTRPTIRDLAKAAGVSVSTVNRVLGGASNVRQGTMQRIQDTAESIGFYGLGSIRGHIAAKRTKHRFGFLLHQPTRAWYRNLAEALKRGCRTRQGCASVQSCGSSSRRICRRRYIAAQLRELGGGVRCRRRRRGGASAGHRRRSTICSSAACRFSR